MNKSLQEKMCTDKDDSRCIQKPYLGTSWWRASHSLSDFVPSHFFLSAEAWSDTSWNVLMNEGASYKEITKEAT